METERINSYNPGARTGHGREGRTGTSHLVKLYSLTRVNGIFVFGPKGQKSRSYWAGRNDSVEKTPISFTSLHVACTKFALRAASQQDRLRNLTVSVTV